MPLYTPHGLKIRLDPDAVAEIVQPLASCHDINDILLDVELWEGLPEGLTTLSASAIALLTGSVGFTLAAGFASYVVGSFIRGFTYSDFLRRIIPLFLGAWPITLLQTVGVAVYLIVQGSYATAVVLCILNAVTYFGAMDIIDLLLIPIRVPLRRILQLAPTHQEGVFIAICNRRAASHSLTLDWEKYSHLAHLP